MTLENAAHGHPAIERNEYHEHKQFALLHVHPHLHDERLSERACSSIAHKHHASRADAVAKIVSIQRRHAGPKPGATPVQMTLAAEPVRAGNGPLPDRGELRALADAVLALAIAIEGRANGQASRVSTSAEQSARGKRIIATLRRGPDGRLLPRPQIL